MLQCPMGSNANGGGDNKTRCSLEQVKMCVDRKEAKHGVEVVANLAFTPQGINENRAGP